MEGSSIQINMQQVKTFLANAKGPVILHISDTATGSYPALKQLLETVRPALVIHTGDCADEYKVGRKPEDRLCYEAGLKELIGILRSANCPVVLTPGNNDDFSGINEAFLSVVPNGTVDTYHGVCIQVDHYPFFAQRQVDFALCGHTGRFDLHYPPQDTEGEAVYINGVFHWALIDSATKRFLRIPCANQRSAMRIFISRHGQVASGEFLNNNPDLPKADPPISPTGVSQAVLLAQELKRLNFRGKIFVSPFLRTLMTAQIVAQRLGLPMYPCMPIREVMKVRGSLQDFRGMTLEQMRQQFPEIPADATIPYPWWDSYLLESQADVEARVYPFMDALLEKGEDVLLIGHGASVRAMQSYLMEKAKIAYTENEPPRFNCALTYFRYSGQKMASLMFNSVSHLPTYMVSANSKLAAPVVEPQEKWYLTQTHLHAGFENFASIRSHAAQAKRLGYDAIFITEHDTRMNRMSRCVEFFRLSAAGSAVSEGEREGWYREDGTPAISVADGDGYSLWLEDGGSASFQSKGKRHQASLLSELSVILRVALPETASMLVDFTLSQRPDDLTQQHLVYGVGNVKQNGWFLPVDRREDGVYTFRLSEDAGYFDPAFGLDNAFLSITVTSLGGQMLVKELNTQRKWVAEEVRKRQAALTKAVSNAYGVRVYSGFEVSVGHHRNCFSEHVPLINYENAGYGLTEQEITEYLRSYNATFAYNHMFQEWKREKTCTHEEAIQQLLAQGVKTRFGGAQLLEVGFPEDKHGFSIEEHLQVWDALAMRGVRMVGYGDSDSHDSTKGWKDGNCFGSWILAKKNTCRALEQAMRAGRVCLGDPNRWHSGWEFTAGDARIGDAIPTEQEENVELQIRLWDLTEPVLLRVVCGGSVHQSIMLQHAQWSGSFWAKRGELTCCPVRLEICDRDGKYLFLTNPIYLTDGTV